MIVRICAVRIGDAELDAGFEVDLDRQKLEAVVIVGGVEERIDLTPQLAQTLRLSCRHTRRRGGGELTPAECLDCGAVGLPHEWFERNLQRHNQSLPDRVKARCNGCGYTGGPDGDDWETTASAYSWGRCPKCGTTNIDVEVFCGTCGTKESTIMGNMTRCLKCHPEPRRGGPSGMEASDGR